MEKIKFSMLLIAIAVFLSAFTIFAVSLIPNKASAWTLDDFRPSVEVQKDIENSRNNIEVQTQSIQFLNDIINDYENNGEVFVENIESVEARYNYLHDYINDNRQSIEELTKMSYAAYFAKTLLDNVVGNSIATNTIFKWGIINFIVGLEDETIVRLLEDYYDTQTELNAAIDNDQKAASVYNNAKADLAKVQAEIPTSQEHIAYWEERLPQIYEIEDYYGAAGESCLSGDGYFNHPCPDGEITSYFGEERDEGDSGGPYHKGTDFAIEEGSPIYAADDGVVIKVSYDGEEVPAAGKFVCIQHSDGLVTYYRHCSQVFVPLGAKVHRGDNIALVGNTGESTGPHLHFQVELNGKAVDALDYL